MDDGVLSTGQVVTAALWVLVTGFIASAWGAAFFGASGMIVGLLAATGCALSAVAAVAHIRLYAARVCREVMAISAGPRPATGRDVGPRRLM